MKKDTLKEIGAGQFGPIFEGPTGQDAVELLLAKRTGEVRNAFSHPKIGEDIDLVWDSGEGKGLISIATDHPDVLPLLSELVRSGEIYAASANRIKLISSLHGKTGIAIIRLDFDGVAKKWLLTGFVNDA
ncbi:MAG: hypothetical protein WCO79_02485 [bacterium]